MDVPIRLFSNSVYSVQLLLFRYSSFFAYCQSKLANVLHANELARLLKVSYFCVHFHDKYHTLQTLAPSDQQFYKLSVTD